MWEAGAGAGAGPGSGDMGSLCVLASLVASLGQAASGLQEWRELPRPATALQDRDTVIACKVYNKVARDI